MFSKKSSVFHKIFLSLLICVLFTGPGFAAISDDDFFDLCAAGSLEQVAFAINNGANVNAKIDVGRTPLMFAAAFNPDPEVLKALLSAGADVHARSNEGWSSEGGMTPLMAAAIGSNPEKIRALIDAGSDVNARNRAQWSPLLLAAGSEISNPEAIKMLIDAGADVNVSDAEGSTPLMLAAARCTNPEIITVLLDGGARPGKKLEVVPSRSGNLTFLAINFAVDNENLRGTEVIKRLEQETDRALLEEKKALELVELCKEGSLQKINDAVKNGANVNARLEHERTPLMLAAWESPDSEVVGALISAGADVHMRDIFGYTPLMFAANFNSNPQIIEVLVGASADVNVNSSGMTPLMAAAFANANPEVISTLLELGADPKVKNKSDQYHMAIYYAKNNGNLKNTDALRKLEELSVEY
jgi:ankyrin repeat protein